MCEIPGLISLQSSCFAGFNFLICFEKHFLYKRETRRKVEYINQAVVWVLSFIPALEISPLLSVSTSPQCGGRKVERGKHTNLFPISILISAENDVLWPVISFNRFVWVIIMDIVISLQRDSSRWMWREGVGERGGQREDGQWDMAAAAVQSLQWHSSICRAAALVCPTLISAGGDWQPCAGPSNNPACTFSISFPSWHIQLSRKKSSDPSLSSIPSLSGLIMSVGKKNRLIIFFSSKGKSQRTSVSLQRLWMCTLESLKASRKLGL